MMMRLKSLVEKQLKFMDHDRINFTQTGFIRFYLAVVTASMYLQAVHTHMLGHE